MSAFGPSGAAMLDAIDKGLVEANATREAWAWLSKVEALPEETLDKLAAQVASAMDTWAINVGLQPRWLLVKAARQRLQVKVPERSVEPR
jgi:hypothetical protein